MVTAILSYHHYATSVLLFLSCLTLLCPYLLPTQPPPQHPCLGVAGPGYLQSLWFLDAKALVPPRGREVSSLLSSFGPHSVTWVPEQLYLCSELHHLVSFWSSSLDRVASNPSRITGSSIFIIILWIYPRRQKGNTPTPPPPLPPQFPCSKLNPLDRISSLIDTLIHVNIHLREKQNKGEVLTVQWPPVWEDTEQLIWGREEIGRPLCLRVLNLKTKKQIMLSYY